MKLYLKLFLMAFLISSGVIAQSIRKDYREMTKNEKDLFVAALKKARNLPGNKNLIKEISDFHDSNFSLIHNNLPNRPGRDVFFPWHRQAIYELEQAMQKNHDPKVSVPIWNTADDQDPKGDLWDNDFMGQFDALWSLNRNVGGDPRARLPTPQQVVAVQDITTSTNPRLSDFQYYSSRLEASVVHAGGHIWTGGVMRTGRSPLDPVFYLHHGMVDKLWQDWREKNPKKTIKFAPTALPRYPKVNPNDITDSRTLGVFYAEDKLAKLDNYTVSNKTLTEELFYYQYKIEAKDKFIIPKDKKCKMESVTEIVLKNGFHSQNGSIYEARIDNNVSTPSPIAWDEGLDSIEKNENPFNTNENLYQSLYEEIHTPKDIKIQVYPNPVISELSFDIISKNLDKNVPVVINMYDMTGNIIKKYTTSVNHNLVNIDLSAFTKGVYFAEVIIKESSYSKKYKIIKQ